MKSMQLLNLLFLRILINGRINDIMKVSLRNLVKLIIFTFVINIIMTTTPVMAYDADARYREGSWVAFGLQHAGLRKAGVGIYEIRGYNKTIQLSDWNTF